MRRKKLDDLDRQILRELQNDGRISNVDLAQKLGISAPPCLRRVRSLEEEGFIRGYHATLNTSALGYKVTVFTLVGLSKHGETELSHFKALVDGWPQVRESYMLAGDFDFLLKIVAHDWESYQQFLTHTLTSAPNVVHVKTMMTAGRTKRLPGVPVDDPADENLMSSVSFQDEGD